MLLLWMQTTYCNCFPRFGPNQLQKGKAHLENYIRSLKKHLGLLNKDCYLCMYTCGHHRVMAKIPRCGEKDSVFCLQDDSRLPADIHIMLLGCLGMLQVPWSVVQVINQSSPDNSFSLPHACAFSWERCFVYSLGVLCEGIVTFFLSMM